MTRVWKWILEFIAAWREEHARQIEHQLRAHDRAAGALDEIEAETQVDSVKQDALKSRTEAARKHGRELGLSILFGLMLCAPVAAQDADARIRTLDLPDLRVYAQQLVDHAREQQAIINAQQWEIEELTQRLHAVAGEIQTIRESIEALAPAKPAGKWSRIFGWVVRLAPVALGMITASR